MAMFRSQESEALFCERVPQLLFPFRGQAGLQKPHS
jgi:hypothetical protein